MKNKTLFLLTSLCGACLLISACSTHQPQHAPHHDNQEYHEQHYKDKSHKKHDNKMHGMHDIAKVKANMMTHNSNGGESEMGAVWFKDTPDGLKMMVDLVYLRPNKTYTAEVYQCGTCDDYTCCAGEAMTVDLPQLKVTKEGERLKQSYMVHGATTDQLNNAKIVLTRDGGYKAAWGKLKRK